MMITKVLIANRGEIARRVIKTCRRLGVETVAIFSEIDANALFVEEADSAFLIGSVELSDSYLNIEKIIALAKQHNCQAIHPGYGFLSENANFATACQQNDLIFIGPDASCIESMGCKKRAKDLMIEADVPVVPGFNLDSLSGSEIEAKAKEVGYPLLVKAASGGGGKGMKRVDGPSDLHDAIASAAREAKKSFNDDTLIIEKYLTSPRHIEVQVFADSQGNVVHLFERDCSIQRRHQKIIEEAPALNIPTPVRNKLHNAAIQAAKAINYCGAGTIEFLLENDAFYFMEMNTRLQVEHPVTEYITDVDLVEWQLHVAAGKQIPLTQEQIQCHGHAIEVRIYAEDPDNDFLPQTGKLTHCQWPDENQDLRVESGVRQQDEISIYYDPMIAKVVCRAADRLGAIQKMHTALQHSYITGLKTNISFLKAIFIQQDFKDNNVTTHYLDNREIRFNAQPLLAANFLAAYINLQPVKTSNPWHRKDNWQSNLNVAQHFSFDIEGETLTSEMRLSSSSHFKFGDVSFEAHLIDSTTVNVFYNNSNLQVKVLPTSSGYNVFYADKQFYATHNHIDYSQQDDQHGRLTSPMPGTVISVNCDKNTQVKAGQVLLIIEAMKMEHRIEATSDGIVEDVFFNVGDQVNDGEQLLSITPIEA